MRRALEKLSGDEEKSRLSRWWNRKKRQKQTGNQDDEWCEAERREETTESEHFWKAEMTEDPPVTAVVVVLLWHGFEHCSDVSMLSEPHHLLTFKSELCSHSMFLNVHESIGVYDGSWLSCQSWLSASFYLISNRPGRVFSRSFSFAQPHTVWSDAAFRAWLSLLTCVFVCLSLPQGLWPVCGLAKLDQRTNSDTR